MVGERNVAWLTPTFHATLQPPPLMTIDEWADRFRVIPPEFSAEPGPWSTARMPPMRAVMRACSPTERWRRVILCKPSQAGGSEALLNLIGYTIDLQPRSMLIVFPNIDAAESFSRERLEPMIKATPRLAAKVLDVGVSTSDNRSSTKKKSFVGGFLNLVGANSTAGLASRPVPVAICDEVDACIENAGRAGNPIKLLTARTSTYADKKEVFVGSPSSAEGETGIIQLWQDSTRGWLETQCPNPDCLTWQVLDFDRMDLATAKLACEKCHHGFSQWEWNGRGEETERWAHEHADHPSAIGFRLSALNSPWLDWRIDIIDEFKEARRVEELGDDSLMRVFVNSRLAQPYQLIGKRIEADLYNERREPYPCHKSSAEVPDAVVLLTAAVDVHDDRVIYEVTGWSAGRQSWGIETGEFRGDPRDTSGDVWQCVERYIIKRVFKYADGRMIRVRLTLVDSGGHATDAVYKFTRAHQPRVFSLKGVGGTGKAIVVRATKRGSGENAWLISVGTDTIKDEFLSRLSVKKPDLPGYCHWPMRENGGDVCGYDYGFFEQLTAEQRVLIHDRLGFAKYRWQKTKTIGNEAFDLGCYNRAALEYLRVRLETMTADILKGVNDRAIQEVETGLGQKILVDETKSAVRKYRLKTEPPKSINLGDEPRPAITIANKPVRTERYGAVTTAF